MTLSPTWCTRSTTIPSSPGARLSTTSPLVSRSAAATPEQHPEASLWWESRLRTSEMVDQSPLFNSRLERLSGEEEQGDLNLAKQNLFPARKRLARLFLRFFYVLLRALKSVSGVRLQLFWSIFHFSHFWFFFLLDNRLCSHEFDENDREKHRPKPLTALKVWHNIQNTP